MAWPTAAVVGHQVQTADTDEPLLEDSPHSVLFVTYVIASAPSGLVATESVTLKDGENIIGTWRLDPGDTKPLLVPAHPLPFGDSLVVSSSSTQVRLSAWGERKGNR